MQLSRSSTPLDLCSTEERRTVRWRYERPASRSALRHHALRRITGNLANALVQRLELAVHALIDLPVELLVNALGLRVRLEHLTNPSHGGDGARVIRVQTQTYRAIDRRAQAAGFVQVRTLGR